MTPAAQLDHALTPALTQRQQQLAQRSRRCIESPQGATLVVAGTRYHNFCSNDYLGLANHPAVVAAFIDGAKRYGVGSGASHLVTGHSHAHHALEDALAEFTQRPKALLFSSGYMANQGLITALINAQDAIFEDRLNHASLLDAGLLSGARFSRFLHNNTQQLQQRLQKSTARRKLVAVDGVFSMDGDTAPLAALAPLCAQHKAWLMVDDAHGFGVLGKTGAGSLEAAGLSAAEAPLLMATLGKALGCAGAFVAGSSTLIETLIQFARSYIYTTALPPAVAMACLTSLKVLQQEPQHRQHLQNAIAFFRQGAKALQLPLMPSETAIQPLLLGTNAAALSMAQQLAERGFWVSAIRPPTVPEGTARLRITLSAAHSLDTIEALLDALAACFALQDGTPLQIRSLS